MRLADFPIQCPLDFDLNRAQQLAKILLNPQADRSVLWFCIVINPRMVDFITPYESIYIQAICPKPKSRLHGDELAFEEFLFTGFKWKVPPKQRLWPAISGTLSDFQDVPWFQSSPKEFIASSPSIWTTNKGTRSPELAIEPAETDDEEEVFKANTITLPRKRLTGHLENVPSA